jgi:hypothetical protein
VEPRLPGAAAGRCRLLGAEHQLSAIISASHIKIKNIEANVSCAFDRLAVAADNVIGA